MNKERLLKLAAFLDELEPELFNYETYADLANVSKDSPCGSHACAIGWIPKVFPELARWDKVHVIRLLDEDFLGPDECAGELFGICRRDVALLFTGLVYPLSLLVTAKDIAHLIRHFVEHDGDLSAYVKRVLKCPSLMHSGL